MIHDWIPFYDVERTLHLSRTVVEVQMQPPKANQISFEFAEEAPEENSRLREWLDSRA